MKTLHGLAFLTSLFLVGSCTSDNGSASSSATPSRGTMSQRLSEKNGYQQDSKGNWVPRTDRRSEFESKGESHLGKKKDFGKKDYKTGDFAKKSWWGGKSYERKSYAGNTDGSQFATSSALQGKDAREASSNLTKTDRYDTQSYATAAARESRNSAITAPSTAQDRVDQRGTVQPEIVDWRQQRSLSIDQSKGLLGR